MKKILFIITLLFTINTAKAQLSGQAKIDSLLKELPKMKEDTNAVNLLKDLSIGFRDIDINKGIEYGLMGVELSKKLKWKKGEALAYYCLGYNYFKKNQVRAKALEYFNLVIDLNDVLEDKTVVALSLYYIGEVYRYQPDYYKARDYYQKSLKKYKELDNKSGMAESLMMIGQMFNYFSDYHKALELFNKALKIREEIGETDKKAYTMNKIGYIYLIHSEYDKAINIFKGSLIAFEELNDKDGIARTLTSLGDAFGLQNKFDKALDYFQEAIKIKEELGDKYYKSEIIHKIGNLYHEQNDYFKAMQYYQQALEIYKVWNYKFALAIMYRDLGKLYLDLSKDSVNITYAESNQFINFNKYTNLNNAIDHILLSIKYLEEVGNKKSRANAFQILAKAYKLKGDHENRANALEEYQKLKDSVFNQENNKKLTQLQYDREEDLKLAEIEKQKVLIIEQEKREKILFYSAVIVVFLIVIILILVLNSRRKSEKLLLNILPISIAKRLKAKEHPIADHFDNASIIFIDIVGFTKLSSDVDPKRVVSVLNDIFTIFDKLADKHGLEKIKTIGDAYMAVAGIPEIQADHAKRIAQMALDIKSEMKDFKTSVGTEIHFRIGIDCGAVVAGVIGEKKFIYDLWSDAVNTASRMESTGESGQIQITDNFKTELEKFEGNWNFTLRGEFEIKGKGLMKTYFLEENNLG